MDTVLCDFTRGNPTSLDPEISLMSHQLQLIELLPNYRERLSRLHLSSESVPIAGDWRASRPPYHLFVILKTHAQG